MDKLGRKVSMVVMVVGIWMVWLQGCGAASSMRGLRTSPVTSTQLGTMTITIMEDTTVKVTETSSGRILLDQPAGRQTWARYCRIATTEHY